MTKTGLDLERIVFIGRTFEEYMAMFSLTMEELDGKRILDCPSGACSFTAIGAQNGLDVTACDIAYYHPGEALASKGKQDLEHAMKQVEKAKKQYVFDYFRDVADLSKHRLHALTDCAAHMQKNPERYIPVTLPVLPFDDAQFDVILSAHFLFTYGDRLDKQFHFDVLDELLRGAKDEIRLFPLVDLSGNRYEHLDDIIALLTSRGCDIEEIQVPYEFQKNANTMMKIRKSN